MSVDPRSSVESLLARYGTIHDVDAQRKAIANLYEIVRARTVSLEKLIGPVRVELLSPLLFHVNDENASRRTRIKACRVLTALLGNGAPAARFEAVTGNEEDLDDERLEKLKGEDKISANYRHHDIQQQSGGTQKTISRINRREAGVIRTSMLKQGGNASSSSNSDGEEPAHTQPIRNERVEVDLVDRPSKKQKMIRSASSRTRKPKRRGFLVPRNPEIPKKRARAERKGLTGVLLEDQATHIKTKEDSWRYLGYDIPLLWYPKTKESLRQRRLMPEDDPASTSNTPRLPQIASAETQKPTSAHNATTIKTFTNRFVGHSIRQQRQQTHAQQERELVYSPRQFDIATEEELEQILVQERALWKAIDEGIREKRLSLPSNFLLEQGLEVAYTREIARRVLDRLFRYAGREPLRAPFRKWHAHTLELRFEEFSRYASLEKLRGIIRRMLRFQIVRGWETWTLFVQDCKLRERVAATIVFQKHWRGIKDRRFFAVHKRRWYAARKIQTWNRMLVQVFAYRHVRANVCIIQRNERKWAVQRMITRWHAAAVPIQSIGRMRPWYVWFKRVKAATLMIQVNYRGVRGRIRFKNVFESFAKSEQNKWRAAVCIQKCWYKYGAHMVVHGIRRHQIMINNAALVIQTRWYIYKEQFPAFIMMRSYLIQDLVDKLEARMGKRAKRAACACKIQSMVRGIFAQRLLARKRFERNAAICAQACCRSFVARQKVKRFAYVVQCVRKLQVMVRAHFAPRHAAASLIQEFACKHLSIREKAGPSWVAQAASQHRATQRRRYAATILQTFIARPLNARRELICRKSQRILQRLARGYLGRRRARAMASVVRQNVATFYVNDLLKATHADMSAYIYHQRNFAATRIQGWYKTCKARIKAKILRKWHARRTSAVRVIQKVIRGLQCRRRLRLEREFERRVRTNRYKSIQDPREIATTAIMHARAFYDSADPMAGMHPVQLLHRLGLAHLWEPLHMGSFRVNDLQKLCTIPEQALYKFLLPYCPDPTTAERDLNDLFLLLKAISAPAHVRRDQAINARILDRFAFIRDVGVARRVFSMTFPDQETRAENFARKILPNRITRAQLARYMRTYSGRPKEAKDHVDKVLLEDPEQETVQKWEVRRYRQCVKVYEMALESISKRSLTDELRALVQDALLRAKQPHIQDSKKACDELRVALDLVIKLVSAAVALQRAIRGKLARAFVHACLARKHYKEELLEGGILKRNWRLQREKEAKEYAEYLEALRRYEIEQSIAHVTRFGYLEIWDEYSQTYYYMRVDDPTGAVWERPTYTYEEDEAARKLQGIARLRGAQLLRRRLEEALRAKEELEREQRAWEALEHERANLVTFRFNLREFNCEADCQETNNTTAASISVFPSWRRKSPSSWANAVQSASLKVKQAQLSVQAKEESLALILREIEGLKARANRGRVCGDRWFHLVKTGKYGLGADDHEKENLLGNWEAFRDSEDDKGGPLRFRHRARGEALKARDSLMDLELEAMAREDKSALSLLLPQAQMYCEDIASRQREDAEFASVYLAHIVHFTPSSKSRMSSYDYKVRCREETRAADCIAAVVRGFLVRRIRYKERLELKRMSAMEAVSKAEAYLESTEALRARLYIPMHITTKYTFVAMPFGWISKRDGYGRTYYMNELSYENAWSRPCFVWAEELSARNIQRIYRGWCGRRAFIETLRSEGISQVACKGIQKAAQTACFGFPGDEGISVEMWFARRGLYEILKDVLDANKNIEKRIKQRFRALVSTHHLPWTKESLLQLGIKDESKIAQVLAHQAEEVRCEDLEMVREPEGLETLFLSQYGSQGARALKFASQASQISNMPITMRQMIVHLAKYKGKPSLATVQLQEEVFNLPTISSPQDQEAAFYILFGAVRRIMIIAANMKIEKMQLELRVLSEKAAALLGRPEERAPGPWLCTRRWPREAMAAYAIREVLDRALLWEVMAVRVQRVYRNYVNLTHWRQLAAWYRERVTVIQCAWRQYAARQLANLRYQQFYSPWEELYDASEDTMYYFDNRVEKSQWHRPREPFKPYGWWPPHPDDIPVPEGKCFICRVENAVRVCEECITKNGVNREFCFDCFAEVHGSSGADFARHRFHAATHTGSNQGQAQGGLLCSQCQGPAIRRCNDCEDFYCLTCYRRLHARGRRREHAWTAYQTNCPVCVECERQVAVVYCESCRDNMCKDCSARVHRKGKRKQHIRVDLPSYETKSGQGL